LNAFLVLFTDMRSPLVTGPVAPIITDMTERFIFHIRLISIIRILYLHYFSVSFCITLLPDGIATPISKQTLSLLFLIIMAGPYARTCLSVLPLDSILLYFHVHIPT
jgi:hypothetical protein